ncbi:MAG: CGGC domain-containing protein, partial [Candidatus Sumerlaeota bacterium]|nr:CGGC domain-containing protein [Candidatus Sumerlaeota bacterium]
SRLARELLKRVGIKKDRIAVQLSSCITKDSYHGPACPHLDYLKTLIQRVGLEVRQDTHINPRAEKRRRAGVYAK